MSVPSTLFQRLDPPVGGWERLIRRRGKQSWMQPAAALTCAVALVALAFPWPYRHHIELNLNGARLIGERSQGTTVRMLDDRQIVALPSGDTNVKLYWIDARDVQASKRQTRTLSASPH